MNVLPCWRSALRPNSIESALTNTVSCSSFTVTARLPTFAPYRRRFPA